MHDHGLPPSRLYSTDILIQMRTGHPHVRGKSKVKRLPILNGSPAWWLYPVHPLEYSQQDKENHELLYFPCIRRLALLSGADRTERNALVASKFFDEPEAF